MSSYIILCIAGSFTLGALVGALVIRKRAYYRGVADQIQSHAESRLSYNLLIASRLAHNDVDGVRHFAENSIDIGILSLYRLQKERPLDQDAKELFEAAITHRRLYPVVKYSREFPLPPFQSEIKEIIDEISSRPAQR